MCVRHVEIRICFKKRLLLQAAESNSFFSTLMCHPHALHNFSAAAGTKDISKISIFLTSIENVKVMACAAVEDRNMCESGKSRGKKKKFQSRLPLLSRSALHLSTLFSAAPHNAK